jgi:CHAD domain-containing protein
MDRTLNELAEVRTSPDEDSVHDLRVSLRRCRSVATVMSEIDPDPAWRDLRKVARKLFRKLGALRDNQVIDAWVKKLQPNDDALASALHARFESLEHEFQQAAIHTSAKFDEKSWKQLARHLRTRSRLVPVNSLAAECLALERFEHAKELHLHALRTEKPKPWHALRIGLKRFRYTVENLLPEHYAAWSENLKRMQDLLGDVHDLDVLAGIVHDADLPGSSDSLKLWEEIIERERHDRLATYRQLTLGKTSLWNEWRHRLPHGARLDAASMARLKVTARAFDPRLRRTSQVSSIASALFEALRRAAAAPVFLEASNRRLLRAATRLHGIGAASKNKSPQKGAYNTLRALSIPPGWSDDDWQILACAVRYYRGAEPDSGRGPFSRLNDEDRTKVQALAGVLRLARALRKCGVESGAGIRAEKSSDAIVLRVPALGDSAEDAARLASGKHLLETPLQTPLILKPIPGKILTLPSQDQALPQISVASD